MYLLFYPRKNLLNLDKLEISKIAYMQVACVSRCFLEESLQLNVLYFDLH